MTELLLNPDCRDGKHVICDGRGWDVHTGDYIPCPCPCHDKDL